MRLSVVLQKNWDSLIKPEKLGVEFGSDPTKTPPSSPSRWSVASA